MKASIVLPNLNGAGWLQGCIESLYAQTEQDFELIVVDNGSTDASLATARSYKGRPGYTLIENTENTGFSAAVNKGIQLAAAPYVLLFNNDAFAEPDMLAQLLQTMQAHPNAFAVQCLMLRHFEPQKADDAGDYMTLLGWACKRGDGLPAARYQKPRRIFSACGGAALYRRAFFDEIGLFDETFFAYLEDVDISWRANNLGYKNYFCPTARCTHIAGATTSGTTGAKYNNFKAVQSGRNNLLLPYKNMPLVMFVLNLPFLIPGYLIKTLFFHIRGFGAPWRQGMREGFAAFGKIKKPPFYWKNLFHYFWVEGSMFAGMFVYIDYRIRRLFQK
ncbi:glycosyltransferase family 2 protein [Ruminococcaceae bacterium OttesenSCG-928-A16]|nr:glycosyltransferase family 2 protein [Ruminococcaceae bacterium OttesenSCG-928-A16]